jgi:ABC-type proline/glycine betaine transport system substrate-binding protein
MIKVKESDQPIEEVVKTWMNNNEDVINKWIPTK